jgi:hypothetical protein
MKLSIFTLFIAQMLTAMTSAQAADEYFQSCHLINEDDYIQSKLVLSGSAFTLTRIAFEEEACHTPYLEYSLEYKIAVTHEEEIDLVVEKIFYRAITKETAKALSLIRFCGISKWQALKAEDVTGKDCSDFLQPSAGSTLYTRLKVDGDSAAIGADSQGHDGGSPLARHKEFELPAFTKSAK